MGKVVRLRERPAGEVVIWPRHKRENHPPGFFCDDAMYPSCPICMFFCCSVCRGAEASLPEDCPGEPMHDAVQNDVMKGTTNYVFGKGWIET